MLFDPNKDFFHLPILWITLGALLACAAIISAVIIIHSHLYFDFSYKGLNNAVTIFKIPLSLIALSIPIIAIYSSNHKSAQTRKQMQSAFHQNVLFNHHSRVEEFCSYSYAYLKNTYEISNPRAVYYKLYPQSKTGSYNLSTEKQKELENLINETKSYIDNILKEDNPRSQFFSKTNNIIDEILNLEKESKIHYNFSLKEKDIFYAVKQISKGKESNTAMTLTDVLAEIINRLKLIHTLMNFYCELNENKNLSYLLNTNITRGNSIFIDNTAHFPALKSRL